MAVEDLVAIAQTVHQVSPDEWRGVQFEAAGHRGEANFGNYDQGPPRQVASGVDGSGDQWSIKIALATSGDLHQVVWQWDTAGFGIPNQGHATITSVVDDRRTYVLGELPRDVAASAHLQVARAGQDPVLLPFADPDPDFDRTFAAYAFSEPVEFTAQIIGADGAVLASWPSP
jgi:hypothetical protein